MSIEDLKKCERESSIYGWVLIASIVIGVIIGIIIK